MVATYCTLQQVSSFLQVTLFASGTAPKNTEVTEFIENNQDTIDAETMNAWRETTISEETHHLKYPEYQRRDGSTIFLKHRNITTLASGTDKLEIWNGSTWEDYLVSRTEGRNNDYWVDKKMGVIFIKTYPRMLPRNFGVRVTYRYGNVTVPNDIRKCCTLMTAIDILGSDDRSILLPEGTSNIPLQSKGQIWQEEIDKILQRRRETVVASL